MLVLICDSCQLSKNQSSSVTCEVCSPAVSGTRREGQQKLRILCLHGFRQTSKSFLGRTCALRKKLKAVADFVFIDGPHELEAVHHSQSTFADKEEGCSPETHSAAREGLNEESNSSNLIQTKFPERPSKSLGQKPEPAAVPAPDVHARRQVRRKRAWLVSPKADQDFDARQYLSQTQGWNQSLEVLTDALSSLGPFDGVLGFSQGASVAAVLCALKQAARIPEDSFKFAVIASGYASPVDEHQELLESIENIHVPSLHIFSVSGDDRQISIAASKDLLSKFDRTTSCGIRHNLGHIIPSTKSYIEEYIVFLAQFCQQQD